MSYSCFGENYVANIVTSLTEGNTINYILASCDTNFHENVDSFTAADEIGHFLRIQKFNYRVK